VGDTQSHIVVKANELVRRFGLTRATVADIAAALGMSPANIYKLLPSKDAIIEAVAEQGLAELKRTIEAAIASSPGALAGIDSLALAVFRGHNQTSIRKKLAISDKRREALICYLSTTMYKTPSISLIAG